MKNIWIRESGWRELSRGLLLLGLLSGLLLRILAWLLVGDKLPQHGFESGVISDNVAAGLGYWMPFYFTQVPMHSFIPPFYPTLMALLKISGLDWVAAIRCIQIALSLLNALLAAELAGRWFGRRAMIWSFFIIALYPLFSIYSLAIFSTTFIMTWVLLLMNIMDRVQGPHPARIGAITGLFHGLAILTSPPLALLGALFLFRLWRYRNPGRLRRTLAYLMVLGLVWSPWLIRNYRVHGSLLLTSTNGGFNFLVGNNPYAAGYTWGDLTLETMWEVIDPTLVAELPEPELEHWFYRRAFGYIADDPLRYAQLYAKKIYYFWWCEDVARFGYPGRWGMGYQMIYGLFLPFAIAGVWLWRWRWRRLLPAFFLFAEYTLLYGSYFVRSRFRWEIEPLLLVFAVAGWFEITRRIRGGGPEKEATA